MRIVINILLIAVIAFLVYLLVHSINEPIKFRAEKEKREKAVSDRLKEVRNAQEMYRTIYGGYAKEFDELTRGLREGRFAFVKVIGDPDDPNFDMKNFEYDTTFTQSIDSIQSLEINLDSLSIVPYSDGVKYTMTADTITYQKTKTHVLEVGVRRKEFMGRYADPKFAKYDDRYDPNSMMKFGSLDGPNLGGNWE